MYSTCEFASRFTPEGLMPETADSSAGTLSRKSSHCSPVMWWRSSETVSPRICVKIVPMRSGSEYGRLLSMSAFTMEKIAVFEPNGSARVTITVAVKPGLRRNCRNPKRRFCPSPVIFPSLVPQRHHGIDFRRAARGDVTCQQRGENQKHDDRGKGQWIGCGHAKEQ